MFVNSAEAAEKGTFDVVVTGAGAAGITIARRLGAAGAAVLLVEGGGLAYSPTSQQMYNGTTDSERPYPISAGSRLRYFGGTTNHWAGWCRPLDTENFQPREGYVGWSIDKTALDPYLNPALAVLDIDPASTWAPEHRTATDANLRTSLQDFDLEEVYWHLSSPPTRFKDKYMDELANSENVLVLLNHSLVDLETDTDGQVTAAVFRQTEGGGEAVEFTAKMFVVACGGIENARLLLYFNEKNGTSYGNVSGQLGKNFMEHPHRRAGEFVILRDDYDHAAQGEVYGQQVRFFKPNVALQRRRGILGCSLRMQINPDTTNEPLLDELARISRLPNRAHWRAGSILVASEQEPRPANSVSLANPWDSLGVPRSHLTWHLSERDVETMRLTAYLFAQLLLRTGYGRCRLEPWVFERGTAIETSWGWHHMGTTKMAGSERDGVVDTNSSLFGTKNLYIAGSSVFPTSGYANPTLTIVQLALRLSDHIEQRLSR